MVGLRASSQEAFMVSSGSESRAWETSADSCRSRVWPGASTGCQFGHGHIDLSPRCRYHLPRGRKSASLPHLELETRAMTIPSAGALIETLRQSGLLDAAQLDELSRAPEAQDVGPELLGECLVQLGWLTRYQVNQLLQGAGALLVMGPYRLLDFLGEG